MLKYIFAYLFTYRILLLKYILICVHKRNAVYSCRHGKRVESYRWRCHARNCAATLPMNLYSRSADSQARCRLRSESSSSLVVRRTHLSSSTIGHFRLPPHEYRTVCLSMSQHHLLSQYFAVAIRLTCSLFLFLNLYVYSAYEVILSFWTLKSFSYTNA